MKFINKEGKTVTFSENEICILWFLITGMTSRKISKWMNMPEKMVSYYKVKAMKKIKVKNKVELNMWLSQKRVYSTESQRSQKSCL